MDDLVCTQAQVGESIKLVSMEEGSQSPRPVKYSPALWMDLINFYRGVS